MGYGSSSVNSADISGRDVVRRLNEALDKTLLNSRPAMQKAVLLVKRRALPLTPIDTGNLRRSAGTEVGQNPDGGVWGVIYYTAAYAPYVHEIDKVYKAPGTQWKFLETALMMSATEILRLFGSELDLTKVMRGELASEAQPPDMPDQFGWIG